MRSNPCSMVEAGTSWLRLTSQMLGYVNFLTCSRKVKECVPSASANIGNQKVLFVDRDRGTDLATCLLAPEVVLKVQSISSQFKKLSTQWWGT